MRAQVWMVGGLALLLLGGCSNTRRCESEQPYQSAETLPVPEDVEGMRVPESPSALRIPQAPESEVPFGQKVADEKKPGKTHYECLDTPPRLRIVTVPKAEGSDKAE